FGRDDWREIILDNLRAYRLSILYGASGVGKSSVLHAGVVRYLRSNASGPVAEDGIPELVVSLASWTSTDPVQSLREAVRDAVEQGPLRLPTSPPDESLADALVSWGKLTGGILLIVLDQFEEYFLYHGDESGPGSFHEELSLALRRRDTPANFLLSIREDALARLDRFEGQVPRLLDNLLRIE